MRTSNLSVPPGDFNLHLDEDLDPIFAMQSFVPEPGRGGLARCARGPAEAAV